MQNEKQYPKAVVLRSSLMITALVVFTIIVVMMLHNLFHSFNSFHQKNTNDKKTVQTLANDNDINWYQNAQIQPSKQGKDNSTSKKTTNTNNVQISPVTKNDNNGNQNNTSQVDKEYQDAMKAPISANQLTGNQYQTQSAPSNTSVPSNSFGSSNPIPSQMGNNAQDQNMQSEKISFAQNNNVAINDDYLSSALKNPMSPYELQAGTIIPGVLITGINSDLPGQITGQVRSNVYDSISGKYLLVPQGAKLTGMYDSQVSYGQERVLIVWKRIIFPNGQSIDLQGMPGIDMSGYAGFNDQVNNHYGKIFGSVILMSILSAGAQLSQPQNNSNPFAAPTVGQTLAQSLGTNIANTGTMITTKNLNIQPTLEIRPGYEFNISVTKDMVFPSAYTG